MQRAVMMTCSSKVGPTTERICWICRCPRFSQICSHDCMRRHGPGIGAALHRPRRSRPVAIAPIAPPLLPRRGLRVGRWCHPSPCAPCTCSWTVSPGSTRPASRRIQHSRHQARPPWPSHEHADAVTYLYDSLASGRQRAVGGNSLVEALVEATLCQSSSTGKFRSGCLICNDRLRTRSTAHWFRSFPVLDQAKRGRFRKLNTQ